MADKSWASRVDVIVVSFVVVVVRTLRPLKATKRWSWSGIGGHVGGDGEGVAIAHLGAEQRAGEAVDLDD